MDLHSLFFQALLEAAYAESLVSFNVVEDLVSILEPYRQRGYDGCGPTSPWLRGICSWDTQCADDSSVIDMLKRQFGSRFDDVQNLANSIGLAIDQKDQRAVESFL